MNKIIIPTGYMGSGSSAITDLIQEFRGYESSHGSFEYVFLHCPGGVFDLEDKLLIGNNAIRSDEALHTFEGTMRELYERKFWWPANYKKNLHPDFRKLTEAYIGKLVQYQPDDYWYVQEKLSPWMFVKMCVRKALMIVSGGKLVLKRPLVYDQMTVSLPYPEEFYEASKSYLEQIFLCMGIEEKNLILDQLLLPFNLWRMEHYFGENTECFVVERDPRDVFISNKYVWAMRDNNPVPYPTDVEEYCEYYRRLRSMERKVENPHVHRIYFEDLIYHYEESVESVRNILGLKKEDHVSRYQYLNPERSIHNTQLFLREEYRKEAKIMERELKEFLYEFPYQREIDIAKVF